MADPYYCRICGQIDEKGIYGHASARCKGSRAVVDAKEVVVDKQPTVVAKKTLHVVYKDKEKRRQYQAAWRRRDRAKRKGYGVPTNSSD